MVASRETIAVPHGKIIFEILWKWLWGSSGWFQGYNEQLPKYLG